MPDQVQRIRVFVASPGDVQQERQELHRVVEEINRTSGGSKGFVLEVVKWETHARPAAGRAQGVINQQIGSYDIFIGIMWKRFGTPTGEAGSGTEEEFQSAYQAWKETEAPRIMFYFNEAPFYTSSPEEAEQLLKVQRFKQNLAGQALIWSYNGADQFADEVRPHLVKEVESILGGQPERSLPASRLPQRRGQEVKSHIFTNIPIPQIPKQYSDLDKRTFIKGAFETIGDYFEQASAVLEKEHPSMKVMLERVDTRTLVCEVYQSGSMVNGCMIWIGGGMMAGANSICLQLGKSIDVHRKGQMNDFASLDENANELRFRLSGMSIVSSQTQSDNASPEAVAEHYWRRLLEPLQHR